MIKTEYLRFLQTLTDGEASDDVCKIANLILQHLTDLIPLSTTHGKRIKKIVELAEASWESISTNIQPMPNQTIQQTTEITRLKSLSVGPFRGFKKQENFDLDSHLVLSYGPNGTGKSSFCEALEYSLLGNVAAAENKRLDPQNYIKNAHTNTFAHPNLVGVTNQGENISIIANEAIYRFCFVEQNRIDRFSRITAQIPIKQTALISTLFGLDAFNNFVRDFTTEIDTRYIDLEGTKTKQLNKKRLVLTGFNQQIESIPNDLKKLDEEELALAYQYRPDATFAQMVTEINGNKQNPGGTIHCIETELQQPIATKCNITTEKLKALKESIDTDLDNLTTKQQKLRAATQQVSFKNLYEAIMQVKQSTPGHCPACKTPLNQVTKDPYTNANEELKKLQHLTTLQKAVEKLNQNINESLATLSQIVNTCCDKLESNILHNFRLAPGKQADIKWWHSLHECMHDSEQAPWQHLEGQVIKLEEADKEIDQLTQKHSDKQNKLNILREFADGITTLKTKRKIYNENLVKAQQAIADFDKENEKLIEEAETEKLTIVKNQDIAEAYSTFVDRLNAYKNSRPTQLVADLGEIVVNLYNAFNRHDTENEKLDSIALPLNQNQKIDISFKNNPEQYFDALHILSEGHIRCIGLAILVAKNIKEDCPFLIFDDPVNAIDDDHRRAIRETFFEDNFLAEKQIIITCHGEEFFKDILNHQLSAKQASQSKTFTFLPKHDSQHIRVDFKCKPRNYIVAAKTCIQDGEIRDALTKSRQALESLAIGKLWSYARKYSDGCLCISMPSSTASIGLRNLTEQLNKKISGESFNDPNKNTLLTHLKKLLGIGRSSQEWQYLNKGVHDEANRPEFDRNVVNEIVNTLENLDAALG